jgi:hypothetical protein
MTLQVPLRDTGVRASRPRALAPRAVVAACVLAVLAGCTGPVADTTGTTARAAPAYPAVNDGPAARDTRLLSPEQRQRILDELAATRERQEAATAEAARSRNGLGRPRSGRRGSPRAFGTAYASPRVPRHP